MTALLRVTRHKDFGTGGTLVEAWTPRPGRQEIRGGAFGFAPLYESFVERELSDHGVLIVQSFGSTASQTVLDEVALHTGGVGFGLDGSDIHGPLRGSRAGWGSPWNIRLRSTTG